MKHEKALVIRYSSMGDVLMASPVIRILYQQLKIKVDLLTKAQYAALYAFSPYINKIHEHEKTSIKALISEDYSFIIDLQKSLRSIWLSWIIRKPRYTYNKEYFRTWRLLKLRQTIPPLSHVTTRYIQALHPLGISDDGKGLNLFLNERLLKPVFNSEKYVVIAAGGTYKTKRIPIQLINELTLKSKQTFVLLGGKDIDTAGLLSNEHVVNLIGKTDIVTSANIIRHADLVITGDTGMMHIAAAFQKAIIVLWGSTSAVFGFYPYFGKYSSQLFKSIEVVDLPCRPCSKYGRKSCPKGHMKCLRSIDAETILKNIEVCLNHAVSK